MRQYPSLGEHIIITKSILDCIIFVGILLPFILFISSPFIIIPATGWTDSNCRVSNVGIINNNLHGDVSFSVNNTTETEKKVQLCEGNCGIATGSVLSCHYMPLATVPLKYRVIMGTSYDRIVKNTVITGGVCALWVIGLLFTLLLCLLYFYNAFIKKETTSKEIFDQYQIEINLAVPQTVQHMLSEGNTMHYFMALSARRQYENVLQVTELKMERLVKNDILILLLIFELVATLGFDIFIVVYVATHLRTLLWAFLCVFTIEILLIILALARRVYSHRSNAYVITDQRLCKLNQSQYAMWLWYDEITSMKIEGKAIWLNTKQATHVHNEGIEFYVFPTYNETLECAKYISERMTTSQSTDVDMI
jgi:hypothetical protein